MININHLSGPRRNDNPFCCNTSRTDVPFFSDKREFLMINGGYQPMIRMTVCPLAAVAAAPVAVRLWLMYIRALLPTSSPRTRNGWSLKSMSKMIVPKEYVCFNEFSQSIFMVIFLRVFLFLLSLWLFILPINVTITNILSIISTFSKHWRLCGKWN